VSAFVSAYVHALCGCWGLGGCVKEHYDDVLLLYPNAPNIMQLVPGIIVESSPLSSSSFFSNQNGVSYRASSLHEKYWQCCTISCQSNINLLRWFQIPGRRKYEQVTAMN